MPAISSSSFAQIGKDHCALRVRDSLYSLEALIFLVVAGKAFLVHVGRIDDLLCGQQVALVYDAVDILVFAEALKGAGGLALLEMCLELFQNVYVEQQLLVCLGRLARALQTAFQMLDVRKNELEIDGLDVARRIDRALDVNDVLVVEAADNVYDCVDLADMGQELVAQTLALACAADQNRRCLRTLRQPGWFSSRDTDRSAAEDAHPVPLPCRRSGQWCRTGSSRSPRLPA